MFLKVICTLLTVKWGQQFTCACTQLLTDLNCNNGGATTTLPSGGFDAFWEVMTGQPSWSDCWKHTHVENISQCNNFLLNLLIGKLVIPLSMVGWCIWCERYMRFRSSYKFCSERNYLINKHLFSCRKTIVISIRVVIDVACFLL